jgi:hypothetical protein
MAADDVERSGQEVLGRRRVEEALSWDRSKEQLRRAYDRLFAD